ncbi:MAG: nickel-dependent lactate racemase [Anaerolineaceae bacterium]|nr:nickel-dependent lactate racemase [Anaerolineaceae bacterium]
MKSVKLKYGRHGLTISVPESVQVFSPVWEAAYDDETAAILQALANPIGVRPLKEQLQPNMSVIIAHTDLTRATPNQLLLPPILAEIEEAGIPKRQVTLINALGSHRSQTEAEMYALLGDKILSQYRCLQHDAFDLQVNTDIAKTVNGQSVKINRNFVEADFRILTGFIEPHFFAGFSGGPKLILPGMAHIETIQWNHRLESIASDKATWGITAGNPIWEEIRAVAKRFSPMFNVNVTLDEQQKINGVFCGDLFASHTAGCEFVREQSMFSTPNLFDMVITGNSGYPLDQNLYQAIKGMCAAAEITRPGGSIIIVAACEDGLPDHGLYAQLLADADSPTQLLENILHGAKSLQDQWQVQKQAAVQTRFEVSVYSDGLSDEQIHKAHFEPIHSIEDEILALLKKNPQAHIAVLPEGPLSIGKFKSAK